MAGINIGGFKLPSIQSNVSSEMKPMQSMAKSITSKLTAHMPKIPAIKGISMRQSPMGSLMPSTKMGAPSVSMPKMTMPKIRTRFPK